MHFLPLTLFFLLFPVGSKAQDATEPKAAPVVEGRETERPINLWPLVYSERGPEYKHVEILFSLIYYERDRRKLSLGFRPLYSRLSDPDKNAAGWSVLWPIATYRRKDDERKLRILPLFWQKLETESSYSIFFPFYSYHRDPDRRKTGVIGYSPISLFDFRKDYKTGATRNRYLLITSEREGATRSLSVAPLYSQRSTPESGSSSLFPVYHRAWSKPEGFSHFSMIGMPERFNLFETKRHEKEELREWHFLTVFSRRHKQDRIFFAAPFYWRWDTDKLDLLHVWPLFGTKRSGTEVERSTIWPFFRWSKDPAVGETDLNLFWPLERHKRRPAYRHDRIFPLFSWTRQTESDQASKWTPIELIAPLPVLYRSTGLDYSYNRFFWLAWAIRRGDSRKDFILNYYNLSDESDQKMHRGVFPLYHTSRWKTGRLDLAPIYFSYEKKDAASGDRLFLFRTAFPLYWDYRTPNRELTTAIPLYLKYKTESYQLKTWFPFYWESKDWEVGSKMTYYFPFYGTYQRGEFHKRNLLFFPLWSRMHDPEIELRAFDVLWPLFHYEKSPTRSSVRVLPFYWQRSSPEGSFAMGFPLYWQFRSTETSHTHFVPFYGDYSKGSFRLSYILGPAYVRMKDEDFERTDVLGSLWSSRRSGQESREHFFPVYWSRSSPGYSRKVVLPLWGSEKADPSYRNTFFLGFHRSVNLFQFASDPKEDYRLTRVLNYFHRRDGGTHFGTFFPIWWTWGDADSNGSILFPLYSLHRDRADDAYDYSFLGLPEGLSLIEFSKDRRQDLASERVLIYYHRRTAERHMMTVFPLYWRWWEPERHRTFLFPLYSSRNQPESTRLGMVGINPDISLFSYGNEKGKLSHRLFPLYGYRETKDESQLSLLGFWHKISLFYGEKGADTISHRFIPLYGYEREGDPEKPRRVEASLLWRVLYYEREQETSDFRFLFRLLRLQQGPERSAFELNPLYFKIRDPKSTYWAVLGGLYGEETFADGKKKRRILWFF